LKTGFCNNTFYETNNKKQRLLSQLSSKITVTFCSFYIKCSMCQLSCWTTHS